MFASIQNNLQFILIMLSWSIVGMISTEIAMPFILGILILFFYKEMYFEALFGFFFLIILSDNTQELWRFAKVIKPYYLILLGVLVLTKYRTLVSDLSIFKRYLPYLFVALIVTLIYAIQLDIALQKLLSYALILFVVPNLVLFEYKRLGSEFFSNLIAFSVIIHFISISVLIAFPEVGISHGGRWQGMFGNPNGLGLFLMVWFITYRIVDFEFPDLFSRRERLFYIILTMLFLWASGSRTAMLSLVVFEFALFGFKYSKFITVIVLVTVVIYFDFLYDFFINVMIDLGLSDELRLDTVEEGSGRYIAWAFAWEYIKYDSFFLGRGMGYDEYIMRMNFNYLASLGHEGGVHNSYLIVWMNTGLIGLITFVFAIFSLFIQGFRKSRFAFPALLAFLISATFEPWLSASLNPYTVIYLIVIVLITKIYKREEALA